MLDFQPLQLQDVALLRPYFRLQPSRICDSTVGGTFLWRDYFQTAYALDGGSLFLRSVMPETGETIYSVPMGGDVPGALRRLAQHCCGEGGTMTLSTVPEEDLSHILALWPDTGVEKTPDWADYLYHAEDLCELKGRKYANQRNHINQFMTRNPDWRFAPITEETLPDAAEVFRRYLEQIEEKDSETFREDARKAKEVLENFALYGFSGGLVYAENRPVAMAIGEVQGDTLYVHIEKADISVRGSYQMIVQQYSRYACVKGVDYINREDDAGDEGLRQSKLSYRPCALLDKYLVRVCPDCCGR